MRSYSISFFKKLFKKIYGKWSYCLTELKSDYQFLIVFIVLQYILSYKRYHGTKSDIRGMFRMVVMSKSE